MSDDIATVTNKPALMTEREAAAYLGFSLSTLRKFRRGGCISFTRLPDGGVAYCEQDLVEFLDARTIEATAGWRHIYVIPSGDYVKVGVAEDPEARWQELRTANPLLEPIAYLTLKQKHAHYIERAVHKSLARYRTVGRGSGREWFRCPKDISIAAVLTVFSNWTEFERQYLSGAH